MILCIRQITNETLLCSTGNSQCSAWLEGKKPKEEIYAYMHGWFTLLNSRDSHNTAKGTIFNFLMAAKSSDMVQRQNACSAYAMLLKPQGLQHARLFCACNFLGKHTGVGCTFPYSRVSSGPGIKPQLLTWRQVLYCWATKQPQWYLNWSLKLEKFFKSQTAFAFKKTKVHLEKQWRS